MRTPIQEEVHDIWLDEEGADQSEAIDYLSDAVDEIESAIANLREAVGDDSFIAGLQSEALSLVAP